jgi:epoxyqueuosine reductase QueG
MECVNMVVKNQSVTKASAGVQEILTKLDVDVAGVTRINDLKGTRLKELALRLLPSAHSIVVVGMEIYPEVPRPPLAGEDNGRGEHE